MSGRDGGSRGAGVGGGPAPVCPRCGYDQSGIVATWEGSCPLRGRCSECGLEFWWRQSLGEQVVGPAWSVEHGTHLTAGRLARAYRAGLWQRGLWGRFELSARVRGRRLAVFAAVTLVAGQVALGVVVSACRTASLVLQGGGVRVWWGPWLWLFPYGRDLEVPVGTRSVLSLPLGPLWLAALLSYATPVAVMFVFTQSMSRVGVRPVHIWRGAAYGLPALFPYVFGCVGLMVALALLDDRMTDGLEWAAAGLFLAAILGWPALQIVRWRSFVRRYIRLEHSNWIALAMSVILALVLVIGALGVYIASGG